MLAKEKQIQLKHNHLKGQAKQFLKDLGFINSEIHEEYFIFHKSMKQKLRVDVVGLKPDRKVAIECGKADVQKMTWLNLFFDEVISLPYMNDRVTCGSARDALMHRIRQLEEKLDQERRESSKQISKLKDNLKNMQWSIGDSRRLFGKAVVVALYKMSCLPNEILNMNCEEVIQRFEKELAEKTAGDVAWFVMHQLNLVGLKDA